MTVRPHIRMTCLGTLPGGEIFSFGLNLGQGGMGETPFISYLLDPNEAVWDDLRDDAVTYWNTTGCSNRATLKSVKFAPIGSNGLYTGAAIERPVGVGGVGIAGPGADSDQVVNQTAMAVTLHTAGDIGRVKGRFYLPMPTHYIGTDGRIAEGSRDYAETQAQVFVNNINNQPGLDVLALRVVVVSEGRKNKDGSVRLGYGNHNVTAVSVGRTLDTIRRRRNKLNEYRGTPSPVSIN